MSTLNITEDIKPLILAAIPNLVSKQVNSEFVTDYENCIAILQVGGESPIHTMGGQKAAIRRPNIGIIIRNQTKTQAREWQEAIIEALDGKTKYNINGHTYMIIQMENEPIMSERDNNKKCYSAIEFSTMIDTN